ncbi:MAG TPA: CPBP family intramembrane glutamic endopeptidase [Candidatus Acidoferrales bacterium]
MNNQRPDSPTFWETVWTLLGAARQRAKGRRLRQSELLQQRRASNNAYWGVLLTMLLAVIINAIAAFVVEGAVKGAQRAEAERKGQVVVSENFLLAVNRSRISEARAPGAGRRIMAAYYPDEAKRIVNEYGGTDEDVEKKLREEMEDEGGRNFVVAGRVERGISGLPQAGALTALSGSTALLLWLAMLIFQGEGLELDLQRRRHPMWEWLFSHPVPEGAVFLAEMLSPIAANPMYWGAPIFVGITYGLVYGLELGVLAAFLIGIPFAIAASCLGKALEIAVILRVAPRTRGAIIGLMGWLGYASMFFFFFSITLIPKIEPVLRKAPDALTRMPWPWLNLYLGAHQGSSFSFLSGLLTCWLFAAVITAAAVQFSVWGAARGLSGNFGAEDSRPATPGKKATQFGREPLYRKEFLWFIRDRSAIVQTILIPLTVAGFQLFNLRGLLAHASGAWNYLCGAAILFGTYFLWILGPKSLLSEGNALWIALTWPRGLEDLLKAKAWLWSMIATAMVVLVLGYAAFAYPQNIKQIALVGIGWFFFGRSMAEKTVTLVTVTSDSGEPQKIPRGRLWAAQLGMLTFALGVLTQQWHIAVMGIVYSYITAAAMWQNFRARLPYLYDPWSEKLPPAPTLMHAMIAISVLIEVGAVVMAIFVGVAGRQHIGMAMAIAYAMCAAVVSVGTANFLRNRDVTLRDVCRWPLAGAAEPEAPSWLDGVGVRGGFAAMALGVAGGVALGLFAHGYEAVLQHIPWAAEMIRKSQEEMAKEPGVLTAYVAMAVFVAPFAEEYLFRGLLFRALDREWGGWRAVLGSAAFFAIYHAPLAWLPVGMLGAANAMLFKKTGRLEAAMILHMVYNAVVFAHF